MSLSKLRFSAPRCGRRSATTCPTRTCSSNLDRMATLASAQPRAVLGGRVMLPGLLLASKGDRVAMNSSVETRYPFLDEDVFAFLAKLHPRWKMRGLRDKYILRLLAERWVPKSIAWRRKAMFRAPLDASTRRRCRRSSISCSARSRCARRATSTRRRCSTGGKRSTTMRHGSTQRTVGRDGPGRRLATQLWHHTFIDPSLADLSRVSSPTRARVSA